MRTRRRARPRSFRSTPGSSARWGGCSPATTSSPACCVSLAACLCAFVLLYRLAARHLDDAGATRAVLYLAVFPTALFLQAVYSESLYLALVLAAFLLAERGSFLGAGAVAGLAMLTRPVGIALLPALAVLAWRAPNRRRALLELAVAVPIAALYPLLLGVWIGEPFAFFRAQEGIWERTLSWAGPLGGLWEGVAAVFDADPPRELALNVQQLAFTLLFLALAVFVWRRFGAPYGLFALVSLAIPLSFPAERMPLLSMSRFGLVVFPLVLALAVLGATAARARCDRGGLGAPARRRRGAMGAVAMGGMNARIVAWLAVVTALAAVGYAAGRSGASPTRTSSTSTRSRSTASSST